MQCACVSGNYYGLSTGIFTSSAVVLAISNIAGAVILITALLHYFSESHLGYCVLIDVYPQSLRPLFYR